MKIYKLTIIALSALFIFGCGAGTTTVQQSGSPTETLKTYIEATKKKDIETMKRSLSKSTLALVEKAAKDQNTTVDDLLKKDDGTAPAELPETREEKIEGETATVEVKNTVTGDFDRIPFVREDGMWKIALDKFMEDAMQRMSEEMKNMPPESSPMGGTTPANTNTNANIK